MSSETPTNCAPCSRHRQHRQRRRALTGTARASEITDEINSRAQAAASGIEQRRAAVRTLIDAGSAVQIDIPAANAEPRAYDASSPEYRDAWLREMATTHDGVRRTYLFGEPTAEQRAAYTMT
ncbi:MAG: hypothetical protein ACLTMP_09920, partial [Eggerthella lenta]